MSLYSVPSHRHTKFHLGMNFFSYYIIKLIFVYNLLHLFYALFFINELYKLIKYASIHFHYLFAIKLLLCFPDVSVTFIFFFFIAVDFFCVPADICDHWYHGAFILFNMGRLLGTTNFRWR